MKKKIIKQTSPKKKKVHPVVSYQYFFVAVGVIMFMSATTIFGAIQPHTAVLGASVTENRQSAPRQNNSQSVYEFGIAGINYILTSLHINYQSIAAYAMQQAILSVKSQLLSPTHK